MTDNYWLVDTVVSKSQIHGCGRFATVNVKSGTLVCVLNASIIPKDNVHLPIKNTAYCVKCPQTYINHSMNANLALDGQLVFVATCDIVAGDELTLDYATLTVSALSFC